MDLIQKTISIQKTAQYHVLGNERSSTLWLIAHGYAMTSDQILKKFVQLDMQDNFYVSAEALSRFYWNLKDDVTIPVASWMTSRFRLDEIRDYSLYLEKFVRLYGTDKTVNFFGFSQGGTTMWRYINIMKPHFNTFVNWSGDIPRDADYDLEYLSDKKLIYVYGNQDKLVDETKIMKLKEWTIQLGLNVEFLEFNGSHKVDAEFLKQLFSGLR